MSDLTGEQDVRGATSTRDAAAMKRRRFVVGTGAATLGLSGVGSASAEATNETKQSSENDGSGTTSLRVLCWNIHHGTGMDGVYDLRRIRDLIGRSDADVVAIQEVDKHFSSRSDCDDQPRRLAESLDMHVDFASNLSSSGCEEPGGYGTAILTAQEYPILESNLYELPSPQVEEGAYNEPRGLQETMIGVGDGAVRVYTTHLDHLFTRRRTEQVEAILDITGAAPGPKIIMGDFNDVPDSAPIQSMTDEYVDTFTSAGNGDSATYPAIYTDSAPEQRIDYIFTSSDGVSVKTAGIDEETLISDHLPIVADLTAAPMGTSLSQQYQVDFIAGEVEETLGENESDYYGRQERLIQYAHTSNGEVVERDTWLNSLADETRQRVSSAPIEVTDGTASVAFTVTEGDSLTLSLATYTLPDGEFDFDTASDQELVNFTTQTFAAGEYTLSLDLPTTDDGNE